MEIDHVFFLIEEGDRYPEWLESLGLVETYRREHPGQGTANICYCFDDIYLELLWVTDRNDIRSPPITRTGLLLRSQWRSNGSCPFGLAWREGPGGVGFDLPCWIFKPPYLPKDMAIQVAVDSDDPRQPFMFQSPGTAAPVDWPPDRRGELQRAAGLDAVTGVTLAIPAGAPPSPALKLLADQTILDLVTGDGAAASLTLTAERRDGSGAMQIALPNPAMG